MSAFPAGTELRCANCHHVFGELLRDVQSGDMVRALDFKWWIRAPRPGDHMFCCSCGGGRGLNLFRPGPYKGLEGLNAPAGAK